MKTSRQSYGEQLDAAVEAGDLETVRTLIQDEKTLFGYVSSEHKLTPLLFQTMRNAGKRDPVKLQRDILHRILAVQYMLLDRVETGIHEKIADYDGRGYPPSHVPEDVASELLPRFGKITSEIYSTMKMLKKIESPPAPAVPPSSQADSASEDV